MEGMRQVGPLEAAEEGVADPRGDTELSFSVFQLSSETEGPGEAGGGISEKAGGGRYTMPGSVSGERASLLHGWPRSGLQNFINHNCFSCESKD